MKLIVKDKKRKAASNTQKEQDKGRFFQSFLLYCLYSVILYSLIFIVLGCATTGNVKESAIPEESRIITAIELQDYSVTVKMSKPFSYTLYKSDDPYKIIVELLDVNLGVFNKTIVSDKAGITEIIPSQIESPFMTRLEIWVSAAWANCRQYALMDRNPRGSNPGLKPGSSTLGRLAGHFLIAVPMQGRRPFSTVFRFVIVTHRYSWRIMVSRWNSEKRLSGSGGIPCGQDCC